MTATEMFLATAERLLMGGSMVVLLLGAGIYFTVKSGVFQLRGLPFILKNTAGTLLKKREPKSQENISSFQAVTTALAGTMGVGNIAGVATALVAGGPGAIFWMWVSAFFGMITKYAEIFLAVKYRQTDKNGRFFGGPMYYMEKGLGKRWLACIFAALCASCSLGIGNMTQVNSVSTAMESVFSIPAGLTGGVVALIVTLVVFGGVKRIASVTEMVIPFISILYICCAGAFLYIHRESVGGAFVLIVESAFTPRCAVSGVTGYGMSQALRLGLSRGVFTNEAGLGSAPIAHAAAACKSPAHQGVWGIFEVFLDTVVVCTITALVVLIAGNGFLWQGGLDGAALTSAAFAGTFGSFGSKFIAISIVFFAVSAMLGWCYYGESALQYLFRGSRAAVVFYRVVFVACILVGATVELTTVWAVSDLLNALMAIPNVAAILLLRRELGFPGKSKSSPANAGEDFRLNL